ncbi:MAG: porin [Rhizobacter sp.]|nr:porin [Rhizobacter sp.]
MKHKRLLSLAAIATLHGAALAQSSVVIYGRVDVSVTKQNSGTTSLNASNGQTGEAGNRWDVRQGSAGRLGFRGQEDLGAGWNANFLMEHRFQPDTGVAENPFWQARSFVELGSPYGAVYLGREYIPAFWPALRLDPWGFDTVGTMGPKHQFALYTIDGGTRSNNTVGYKTPSVAGFTAQFSQALGEGGSRKRATGANVEYRKGAIYFGAALDRVDSNQEMKLIGGAYDFGVVRPALTFTKSTVAGIKYSNVSLAATAPIGRGTLKAALSKLDPNGDDNDTTRVGLGYEHFLSKRTSVYADVGSADQQGRAAGRELTRTTAVDFGLKHQF